MILFIIIMLVILFSIHSILPTYYHRKLNTETIKNCPENGIMLTFNGGPHEEYTTQLLDVLLENEVKATFFVVAKNAKQYPYLIKRMEREGHTIALHSLEHRNPWFYSYFYTKKDFEKSLAILGQIGVKFHYYRPPCGHTNLFSSYFAHKHQLKMIFWNVMVQDWKYNSVSLIIQNKLLREVRPHSIICLHDAGHDLYSDPLAPQRTIEALKTTIPILKKQGISFITPERSS